MDPSRPRRGHHTAARLAWPVLVLIVALWVASRIFAPPPPGMESLDPAPWHVAMAAYGVIGAIIVHRQPGNIVGWLFLAVGIFDPLSGAVRALAILDLGPRVVPGADVAAWLQSWLWAPSLAGLALLVAVFPTGRPLPGAWRWGPALTLFATFVLLVAAPVALWPHRGPGLLSESTQLPGIANVVTNGGFVLLMLSAAVGVVSLAVRLRRSRGDERQQVKWFAFAAAVAALQAVTDIIVLDGLGVGYSMIREALSSLALLILPVAAGIAMLKYRLYDIDRLINRTVVYGALTAGCAVVYLATVALVRWLTGSIMGDGNVAVAASTLAVAAAFRPARQRVQQAVDRRFNRARYDATQTVSRFSSRLRDEVELETLTAELIGVVGTTMQPSRATLWLNSAVLAPTGHGQDAPARLNASSG